MSKPKVVLYNPKAVFWTLPLPLIAIGSALDREVYDVVLIDGRLDSPADLRRALDGAICLGVTVLTGAPLLDALHVTRAVHASHPQLPIIWGGWHPSLFLSMSAGEPGVAAAVNGQGEETFAELVARIVAGVPLEGTPGCALQVDGEVRVQPPRPMRNINDFPAHDFDLIDVERYFRHKNQRQLDYISSQGCMFRCAFCADPAVFNRGWHGFTPERTVAELTALWQRYQYTDISFQDETYFTHSRRVDAIAEGLIQAGIQSTWTGTLRADQGRRLDDAVLAKCKRSGLRRVMIGMEAGSQETIDAIQKDIKVDDMWVTADKLIRHDIGAIINVIVGFPGESEASVAESLRVAAELSRMSPQFEIAVFYFKPYPGNPIAAKLERDGYRFPATLDEWGKFDYVGSGNGGTGNDWLNDAQYAEIEGFKFYQRYAYDGRREPHRRALAAVCQARVERRFYRFPVERRLIEFIKPRQALS